MLAVLHGQRRRVLWLAVFMMALLSQSLSPFHPPAAIAASHASHINHAASVGKASDHGGKHDNQKMMASCPMTSCSPASLPDGGLAVPDTVVSRLSPIGSAELSGVIPALELRPPIAVSDQA